MKNGAMVGEWDAAADEWDGNVAVRAYADAAVGSLMSVADAAGVDITGATVCDFGCGTGLLTERLADRCERIDAVDTSQAMLAVLQAKIAWHRWRHVRTLDRLPPATQRYDAIVCSSVLSFVDDYSETVRALVDQLATGGLFVQWDWERDPGDNEAHGFTRMEIRRTLEGVGLEDVAVGTGFEVTVEGHPMRPLVGSGRRPS